MGKASSIGSACTLPWATVAGLLALLGCVSPLTLPEPPDLTDLVMRYDEPTGKLDEDSLQEVLSAYAVRLEQLERLGGLAGVLGGVEAFSDSITEDDSGGITLNSLPVASDALLTFRGRCGNTEGSDGGFELQVVVQASELIPVAWGDLQGCLVERSVAGRLVDVVFAGQLAMRFPAATKVGKSLLGDTLVSFDFDEVRIEGLPVEPQRGHSRVQDGRLSFLVALSEESGVLVSTTADAGKLLLEGADSAFVCNRESRQCAAVP